MEIVQSLDRARAASQRARAPVLRALERRRAEPLRSWPSTRASTATRWSRSPTPRSWRRPPRPRPTRRACAATPRRSARTWRCGTRSPRAGGRGRPRADAARRRRQPARARAAQTRACASAWTAGADLLEHLAVLYVIEAGQPQISQTKIEGLVAHYGYRAEGPATEYFRVHEPRRRARARRARADRGAARAASPTPRRRPSGCSSARGGRCRATGSCSTACEARRAPERGRLASGASARRRRAGAAGSAPRAARRTARRRPTVARFRLETPARIGILTRASARSMQLRR